MHRLAFGCKLYSELATGRHAHACQISRGFFPNMHATDSGGFTTAFQRRPTRRKMGVILTDSNLFIPSLRTYAG